MNVDINNFTVVLATLLGTGGVGVFGFMKVFKKISKVEADHILFIVTLAFSILGAAAEYILQLKGKLPPEIMGLTAPTILGVATTVFKISQYADRLLLQHYAQAPAAIDEAATTVKQAVADGKEVMSGVEAVAQDAKAVEANVFAG